MSESKFFYPKAYALVGGKRVDPSNINLQYNINIGSGSLGLAECVMTGENTAYAPFYTPGAEPIIKELADDQRRMFVEFDSQIMRLELRNDSRQLQHSYKGHLHNRSTSISTASSQCTRMWKGGHDLITMAQGFNTSIYSPNLVSDQGSVAPDTIGEIKGTPLKRIKQMLEEGMRLFPNQMAEEDDAVRIPKMRVHEINTKLWGKLGGLFEKEDDNPELNDLLTHNVLSRSFNSDLWEYFKSSANLDAALSAAMYEMGFVFVPTENRWATIDTLVNQSSTLRVVNNDGLSGEIGNFGKAAINNVAFVLNLKGGQGSVKENTTAIGYLWPKSAFPGRVKMLRPPKWLDAALSKDVAAVESTNNIVTKQSPNTIGRIQQIEASRKSVYSAQVKAVNELLDKYAKRFSQLKWLEYTIGMTTQTLVVPLDYSWKLGKRYAIRGGSGINHYTNYFEGTLMGINHSIQERGAYTTLTFSYVIMAGFTLPGRRL